MKYYKFKHLFDLFSKKETGSIFHQMNQASLITIIGQTGAGKSRLIFSYYDYLANQHGSNGFEIRAFDTMRTNFGSKDPIYKYLGKNYRLGDEIRQGLSDSIALVQDRASGIVDKAKFLVFHITECDMVVSWEDLSPPTLYLIELISEIGKKANVQLIYETSRPSTDGMPDSVIDQSDLKIMFQPGHPIDAKRFMPDVSDVPNAECICAVKAKSLPPQHINLQGELNRVW